VKYVEIRDDDSTLILEVFKDGSGCLEICYDGEVNSYPICLKKKNLIKLADCLNKFIK
jgi:hypothetical protein